MTSENPYLDLIDQDSATNVRQSMQTAIDKQPDTEAKLQALGKRYGIPTEAIRLDKDPVERRAKLDAVDYDSLVKQYPATGKFLADPANAAISHDDVDNLTETEDVLHQAKNIGKAALASVYGATSGIMGDVEAGTDLFQQSITGPMADLGVLPVDIGAPVAGAVRSIRKSQTEWRDYLAPKGATALESGVYSGVESLGQNLLTIPFVMLGGGGAQAALRSMSAITGGQSYGKARDKGIDPLQSAVYAGGDAAIEYATEFTGTERLFGDLAMSTPFVKTLMHSIMPDMLGEQAATVLQDYNEKSVLNPDKTMQQYLDERPDAAVQTAIATLIGQGGMVSVAKGMDAIAKRDEIKAQTGEETGSMIEKLNQVATASKVLQRDPDTFEAMVADATEDGPTENVYIDAKALYQSGVADQIAALSPSVAEQLPQALETYGTIQIPTAEYAARIASTEFAAPLVDHLKFDPEGFSRAEAQSHLEQFADEQQAEVDRVLAQVKDDSTFKTSSDVVRDEIRNQLEATGLNGKVKSANDSFAALMSSFYAVTAARTGQTPEQLYQQYPVQITTDGRVGIGKRLDQSFISEGKTDSTIGREEAAARFSEFGGYEYKDNTLYKGGEPVASLKLRVDGNRLIIDDIETKQKGQGVGTEAIKAIVTHAHATGLTPALFTDAMRGKEHQKRLRNYYARVGFTQNKGANKVRGLKEEFYYTGSENQLYQSGDTIAIDGKERPATNSNGQPLAQTAEGLRAFWKWFGDSKVVDNQGRPMVVYHGSINGGGFTEFIDSEGVFFTEDRVHASSYAGNNEDAKDYYSYAYDSDEIPGTIYPSYLKISNPYFADFKGRDWKGRLLDDEGDYISGTDIGGLNTHTIEENARENGFDGVVIKNVVDPGMEHSLVGYSKKPENIYGVFSRYQIKSADDNNGTFDANDPNILHQDETQHRGAFSPETLTISLFKTQNLSTFLHESGHFFLHVQTDIASKLQKEAELFGFDSLNEGEQSIVKDTEAVMNWFGIGSIEDWFALDFEAQRDYHEKFARGFESYLFEGKAPSIELQGVFQRFRAWLMGVYRSVKNLNVEISPELRQVFDRMIATNDQIALAERGRSMMPLFTSAEQAGMTPEEFAEYQKLGVDGINESIQELQAKAMRDMAFVRNAHGRMVKKLQKEAAEKRRELRMDVREEVMAQPVYRAWSFLTRKLSDLDKLPTAKPKSNPDIVDPSRDSLFTAIAKLGGINKADAVAEWGVDPAYKPKAGVFGKPVWRLDTGKSLEAMAESLLEHGYLAADENGKHDLREFEDKFDAELRGNPQHSNQYDPSVDEPLRAGERATNLQDLLAGRLDLGELIGLGVPQDVVKILQARKMTAGSGLHPDIVAELLDAGFTSGDQMVRELAAADDPKELIEAETDARMLEQYGELATPAAIARSADMAIHNDVRAKMLATEVNGLARATGKRKILVSAAKEYVSTIIARTKVRNLSAGKYASAAVQAGKAAQKAQIKGDTQVAVAEKRNQLINELATRATYDAQDEVAKTLAYLKKFSKDIKTLDADYADQIHALLERFDLRQRSNKEIDKRTSFANWIKAQEEISVVPDIPDEMRDEAFRTSYKNLTVEELRGLSDTVKTIEHLGRLKHKLLTAKNNRDIDQIKTEIRDGIDAHATGRVANTRTATTKIGQFAQGALKFYASHIKVASWARIMDGDRDGGPVWEYFIRSANEKSAHEVTQRVAATKALSDILEPVFKLGKMSGKGQHFPSINRALNREERIAIALNTGNEGNLQRLLDGEGWTIQKITPVLQSMTAEEWQAVQKIWDHIESYRLEIAAKERRVYGKEPNWVTPKPFTVMVKSASGVPVEVHMRGGYFPIKYDPAASAKAEQHDAAEEGKRLLQGAYSAATTRRSFTKARADEVKGRPLLYSLSGVYSGVNEIIHDLSWHEWLIDMNRLLRPGRIDTAIRTQYGPAVVAQFKSWKDDIALGDAGGNHPAEWALGKLRQHVSAAGLGFNVMSAAMQPLGFTQSVVRVGAPWIARGVSKFVADIPGSIKSTNEKSEFMRNRMRTRFRELNEIRNRVQDESPTQAAINAGKFFLMMRSQQLVDVPTWLGAYEKALVSGEEDDRAIALADQAVIDSQGGGELKDLAGIERGGQLLKVFTVFYTFMNTAFNLNTQTLMSDKAKGKKAANLLMLNVVPAVLGLALKQALTPNGGDDDGWDDLPGKLIGGQFDYLMGQMVIVREFTEAAKMLLGVSDSARWYQGPAGLRIASDAWSFATQAHQAEFDDAFRKSAINLIGDVTGLPSAQTNRTITGVTAIAEGETKNPMAIAFGFRR